LVFIEGEIYKRFRVFVGEVGGEGKMCQKVAWKLQKYVLRGVEGGDGDGKPRFAHF